MTILPQNYFLENDVVDLAKSLTSGPGMVCQALGIDRGHNGLLLGDTDQFIHQFFGQKGKLWIEDRGDQPLIQAAPRIGIAYAQEDALLPYRFLLGENH